jgi:hypothetical protein
MLGSKLDFHCHVRFVYFQAQKKKSIGPISYFCSSLRMSLFKPVGLEAQFVLL